MLNAHTACPVVFLVMCAVYTFNGVSLVYAIKENKLVFLYDIILVDLLWVIRNAVCSFTNLHKECSEQTKAFCELYHSLEETDICWWLVLKCPKLYTVPWWHLVSFVWINNHMRWRQIKQELVNFTWHFLRWPVSSLKCVWLSLSIKLLLDFLSSCFLSSLGLGFLFFMLADGLMLCC